ncbi:guanylate kinase [Azotosporobacter soli]|uniref:guanylate kinase n=1 Tax=Azotosporobacter soli TaxID=3055040 RepID=UPI0031FF255C
MARKGNLIVVSGPSGAGKGTICQEMFRQHCDLQYSISATTRAPRTGEVDGVNYLFVAKAQFETMIEQDDLLEWAEVYGNYYGTPRSYVMEMLASGKDVVLEIDTQGALQVKKKFPEGIFIYIVPPSLEELSKRIYNRGTDAPDVIERRLSCAKEELICASEYNYVVVNDQLDQAVDKVRAIIVAERCRVQRNLDVVDEVLHTSC